MALLAFVLVFACVALAELGPRWIRSRARRRSAGPPQAASLPVQDAADEDDDNEQREVALARQFVSGDMRAAEYRQHMGELAADDAGIRPLVVPPDVGS
jgi:hypothetical protein